MSVGRGAWVVGCGAWDIGSGVWGMRCWRVGRGLWRVGCGPLNHPALFLLIIRPIISANNINLLKYPH